MEYFGNITLHPAFMKSRSSTIYIHGYKENVEVLSVQTVINAYLKKNVTNIFALNWGNYSNGNYPHIVMHVIGVSLKSIFHLQSHEKFSSSNRLVSLWEFA